MTGKPASHQHQPITVLIMGANGFIGHRLIEHLLRHDDTQVIAIDLFDDRLTSFMNHPRFDFHRLDIAENFARLSKIAATVDVLLPLAAIACPSQYVADPLKVFELNFEQNLAYIRLCANTGTRLIFPSTSEVYGMSTTVPLDPDTTPLTMGPTHKSRWIYATSKALLERVIFGYGEKDKLDFTIFRPFNFIGGGQDRLQPGSKPRVVPQFLLNLALNQPLRLVNGGAQKRCLTAIEDGVEAIAAIIMDRTGRSRGLVLNIGNPANECSIRELAERLLARAAQHPVYQEAALAAHIVETDGATHFGTGYQDVERRVPDISHIRKALGWQPQQNIDQLLDAALEGYTDEFLALRNQATHQRDA